MNRKPATPEEELDLLDQQPGYSVPGYISDEGVVIKQKYVSVDHQELHDKYNEYILNHQAEHTRMNRSLSIIRWVLIIFALYLMLIRLV